MTVGHSKDTSAGAVSSSQAGWSHFAHEADIGVCGYGPTLADAFEQGALALTAVVTDAPVDAAGQVAISVSEDDPEDMFVAWLNAVVYEMAVQGLIFGDFRVTIAGGDLQAVAYGEPVDQKKHHPACEIKGATYTELSVTQAQDGQWIARCVVDV